MASLSRSVVQPRNLLTVPRVTAAPDTEGGPGWARLRVDGLVCGLCAGRVARRLRETSGVLDADCDLATGQALVRYDPDRVSPETLRAAAESAAVAMPLRRALVRGAARWRGRGERRDG